MHLQRWGATRVAPWIVALALAGPARAAEPQQDLDAAEKAYIDLDFERANKLADALSKRRGLTHDQLVRATRLLARTYAILDQEAPARQAFVLLLTYSPDEKEDRNLPPKVTDRQLEARGTLRGYGSAPGIEASATVSSTESTLKITTRDPTSIVKKVNVAYRWGPMGAFVTGNVGVGSAVPFPVQAAPSGQNRLEYYAQALDERDNVVFEAGNPATPRLALVDLLAPRPTPTTPTRDGGESKSVLSSPLFWVVTAVVLVGGGTGLFFALRPKREEMLPPTQGALHPIPFCGAARCQ